MVCVSDVLYSCLAFHCHHLLFKTAFAFEFSRQPYHQPSPLVPFTEISSVPASCPCNCPPRPVSLFIDHNWKRVPNTLMHFLWGNPVRRPLDVDFYTPRQATISTVPFCALLCVVYGLGLKIAKKILLNKKNTLTPKPMAIRDRSEVASGASWAAKAGFTKNS